LGNTKIPAESAGKEMGGKPDRSCGNCGSKDWWFRVTNFKPDEWICGFCHPKPRDFKEKGENKLKYQEVDE